MSSLQAVMHCLLQGERRKGYEPENLFLLIKSPPKNYQRKSKQLFVLTEFPGGGCVLCVYFTSSEIPLSFTFLL